VITEIAVLTIDPSRAADFEAAVAQAAPQFQSAPGCLGMALERIIDDPSRYRLVVRWATLEAHTVDFRNSPNFMAWRALAGPFFTAPPAVEHSQQVARHF
jgi:quinol monooxygenase YgiN